MRLEHRWERTRVVLGGIRWHAWRCSVCGRTWILTQQSPLQDKCPGRKVMSGD